PQAFYNGTVGESFVKDVREVGRILTMEDLRSYKVKVMDVMDVDVIGYTILGMPPPSSGTVGLSLVMNILDSYGTPDAVKGPLGLHRLIEALKHMFAIRMNLGDPDFINEANYVSDTLSPSFAKELREKIFNNTTFPSKYYMSRWTQLKYHGTSHLCIINAERNAISMTTTVKYSFGAGVLSPSTGIVLNNEMDDFSTPTEKSKDKLPPALLNYIEPNKRHLSSMTPLIILKVLYYKPHFDQLFKRTVIEVWTKVLKVCGAPRAVKVDKSVDENEMVDYADSESSPEREVEVGGALKMGVMDSWLWNCHLVAGAGCSKPNGPLGDNLSKNLVERLSALRTRIVVMAGQEAPTTTKPRRKTATQHGGSSLADPQQALEDYLPVLLGFDVWTSCVVVYYILVAAAFLKV
ncbi:hypothetical protein IFM89_033612, partial [Coptis chinensis]